MRWRRCGWWMSFIGGRSKELVTTKARRHEEKENRNHRRDAEAAEKTKKGMLVVGFAIDAIML